MRSRIRLGLWSGSRGRIECNDSIIENRVFNLPDQCCSVGAAGWVEWGGRWRESAWLMNSLQHLQVCGDMSAPVTLGLHIGQLSRAITSLADGRLEARPASKSLPPHAGREREDCGNAGWPLPTVVQTDKHHS